MDCYPNCVGEASIFITDSMEPFLRRIPARYMTQATINDLTADQSLKYYLSHKKKFQQLLPILA